MSFELGITSQKRLTQPFLYQRIETDDVVFSTSEGSNLSKTIGYALLVISALCSAFGNSLESVSTLVWLITPTLLVGLHYVLQPFQLSSSATATALVFVVVSQGAGFMVGFLTMFSDEDVTASTVLITFAVGCFLWVIISAVSLLALLGFTQKYESSVWASFIFPITYTTVMHTVIGRVFSTFPSICNAVLDSAPLRQFASLGGSASITFAVTSVGSVCASALLSRESTPSNRKKMEFAAGSVVITYAVLTIIAGFLLQADSFYQKDVSTQIIPELNVSCVFGFSFRENANPVEWAQMWTTTTSRLAAGDSIVMWSEESLEIISDVQEDQVVSRARDMVKTGNSFLAITYMKRYAKQANSTNMMVLIAPGGDIAWRYQKSHPVPVVEAGVTPGPPIVPIYDTEKLVSGRSVRMGGSICFDLDYPDYIRQAGSHQVDVFLQPSWTWKAISTRHFEGDALRAVENGFNLFRCSSDGESGVAAANGKITGRQFTGHDPAAIVTFSLPIHDRVSTIYNSVGFLFEWFLALFTIVIWVHLLFL